MIGLGRPLESSTCSRADCRNTGRWRLDWRNPRIHSADRVKTWLACDEHVEYLREFLAARDFPLTVSALDTFAPDSPENQR
ncbi:MULTISPECIES: hypothetical protein [unclassified Cryobacterium]|uniref:hypothetical protein n=1 Tax=unclassified Cryobacterium TaxID=2649013 RepID=UPI000CE31831|nr:MULTISPECIES: hypothetical protein [unclassified Cryobacterium]